MKKIILGTILLCFNLSTSGQVDVGDSLFIAQVKKYAFKEFGCELPGNYYTTWKENEEPYFVLFISLPDTVSYPEDFKKFQSEYPCKSYKSEWEANWVGSPWKEKGFHTFVYKTYGNSKTELNSRFLSYSEEARAFIVFHELLHNYINYFRIKIPYEFHESLGDVIGNYLTLKYARMTFQVDPGCALIQTELNEEIYSCLNGYLHKISRSSKNSQSLNQSCYSETQALLTRGNTFQKDRFANGANNAFLLKNSNYCKNYFLLKKVLEKQGSVRKLLEIIKALPAKPEDCLKYITGFAGE